MASLQIMRLRRRLRRRLPDRGGPTSRATHGRPGAAAGDAHVGRILRRANHRRSAGAAFGGGQRVGTLPGVGLRCADRHICLFLPIPHPRILVAERKPNLFVYLSPIRRIRDLRRDAGPLRIRHPDIADLQGCSAAKDSADIA
jgi:hypothetical protein